LNATRLIIVGCGSPDAGDDALGPIVADSLRERLPAEVEIKTDYAGGANLLDWCEGVEMLILVDAALATADFAVGEWRRLCFPFERECLRTLAFHNTHSLGLAEALDLASSLGRLPKEVLIFAVAGGQFELGTGLSPAVQRSVSKVRSAVQEEVIKRLQDSSLKSWCDSDKS